MNSSTTMDSPKSCNIASLQPTCIATLKLPTPHISCLAIHNTLLYAASTSEIAVFDLSNNTYIDTFSTKDPTSGSIKSIAFSNTKVFTAHQDCKIRLWQMIPSNEHHLISTLPTVKDRFRRFILPGNYVKVRRHEKKLWIEHWDTVSGLVVHGGVMYSVSWDKSLKLWNLENHKCLESVKAHEDAVNTVAVSCKGTVYTGSADGVIRVWEKVTKERRHRLVGTLERHKSSVNAMALSGDGSMLFSGGCDCCVLVWKRKDNGGGDEHDMVFVEALKGHRGAVLCLVNLGGLIISGSSDGTVRIWDHLDGEKSTTGYSCLLVLEGHERPVKSVVGVRRRGVCNDSFLICSGSLDGEIKVWDIITSQTQSKLRLWD